MKKMNGDADESSASSGMEIVKTNKSNRYISLSNFVLTWENSKNIREKYNDKYEKK